ncbi:MAG: DNA-binding protein, partial [Bacteroides sp.]
VKFRADSKLKENIGIIEVEHTKYGAHSRRLSNEEIRVRLAKYFSERKVMTRSDFQACCGMTRNTATRHILRLRQEGVLKNIGTRMQPIYVPGEG